MKILLPKGWTLSAPYRASLHISGRPTTHPMRRTLTNPYDDAERTTDAALNATTLDYINTILSNYGEIPAQVTT